MDNRMNTELIGWLSTCGAQGDLHTVPVWFLHGGDNVRIFTAPSSKKVKNLATHSNASFHLNGGELGNVLSLSGSVDLIQYTPGTNFLPPEYLEKYADLMTKQGWPQQHLEANFTTEIRISIDKVLTW